MNAHEKDLKKSLELKHSHLETVKRKFEITANRQELKGIKKYGQPLDPLDNYDWLKMAAEEQVDGYKYLVAEMEKREFIVNKIRNLIDVTVFDTDGSVIAEINHWLDELEGKNHEGN